MSTFDKTMRFNFPEEPFEHDVNEVLLQVYEALQEKGYNPINQIVGYLLSGDPAYIPRHRDARILFGSLSVTKLLKNWLNRI